MYGDAPPNSFPLSGIACQEATKRDFDVHSATIETAKSTRDLQSSVSTLFSAQALITNDIKLMSKAFALRWNQQVAQHFTTQDKKKRLECELLKQASLKDFEDEAFLRRLRHLRGSVGGEHWAYRKILRSTIDFIRVVIKPKEAVHLREIIIKTDDKMFHVSRELLKRL